MDKGHKELNDKRWSSLMQKSCAGDAESYRELLEEIMPLLRSYVSKRVSNASYVDDITQEILMGIHKMRHTYDPTRSFSTWMFSIAKYKFIDYARKAKRKFSKEIFPPEDLGGSDNGEMTEYDKADLRMDLNAVSKYLNPQQRKILMDLKVRGLSVKEVARLNKISESLVKVTAHRAYKIFRERLEKD